MKFLNNLSISRGPISCAIENTMDLELYKGGIFEDKTGTKEHNHIVTVVGWGVDEKTN